MKKIVPIILAGGQGNRLWPISRRNSPKQFIRLNGDLSLFEKAIDRCKIFGTTPVVVTNVAYRFEVKQQLASTRADILLEPESKNTAIAISTAVCYIREKYGDDTIVLVLSSDHEFDLTDEFVNTIDPENMFMTFGIKPTRIETEYGYIETDGYVPYEKTISSRFVEKPNRDTAEQYYVSGRYLWNSGMFAFSAKTFCEWMEKLSPEILQDAILSIGNSTVIDNDVFLCPEIYAITKKISIDYALFEKLDQFLVIPITDFWSDMGSFKSYWDVNEKDEHNNVTMGNVHTFDSSGNLVISTTGKNVVLNGITNSVIVDTPDVTYVGDMNDAASMRDIVNYFDSLNTKIVNENTTVHRPWGQYTEILKGERFKVKSIIVTPGSKLSLQSHHHRSEHWVVVRGMAEVTNGETVMMLTENQSTYIPVGQIHRLSNPGKIDLEIIEIQTGPYLEEDDIVRYEDIYSRV